MRLFALVGFASSGKNTAADYIINQLGFIKHSFAESLKDVLASIFCWDRNLLEGDTQESRLWRETVDEWWANKLNIPTFTPRFAMQNIGTNLFRHHFNEDIWIYNIERKLISYDNTNVIITDTRFSNEIYMIRKFNGKIIRIKKDAEPVWFEKARLANEGDLVSQHEMTNINIHESEWAWIGQKIDHTIENDSTIENLQNKLLNYINV